MGFGHNEMRGGIAILNSKDNSPYNWPNRMLQYHIDYFAAIVLDVIFLIYNCFSRYSKMLSTQSKALTLALVYILTVLSKIRPNLK